MYLSRLILNPRSRQVRRELADVYELHRTVMKAFAGRLAADERVLFRVDVQPRTGVPTLLVQSLHQPDWGFLTGPGKAYLLSPDDLPLGVDNPASKEMNLQLRRGQALAFRLRANPTFRKMVEKDDGEKVKKRLGIFKEEDQYQWLQRKIEAAGARLVSANTANDARVGGKLFRENEEHTLSFVSVQFDGVLQVQDPAKLLASLKAGIGSGKGLGFGLLSLAPTGG